MTEEVITRSTLWQSGFARVGDGRDQDRDELEHALLGFRRRMVPLLSLIVRDLPTYTVHDIDHIDALWEIGDVVAGSQYKLNPAEAFVFGSALLIHDAGMTLAAYPTGLRGLRDTVAWRDNAAAARRALPAVFSQNPTEEESLQNKSFLDAVMPATLRDLHADAANFLIRQRWTPSGSGDQEFLLEHADFRDFYGETIGQIAASHHWDVRRVVSSLSVPLNAHPRHPHEWTVDKIKLAMLLRCADAAHIDGRRAPRLLFALIQPAGIAAQHWKFQAKIAKPRVVDGRLRYTSNAAFSVDEVDAWQLAWDTARMIDRELGEANEVLAGQQSQTLAVSSVDGVRSPTEFARYVQVRGWTPILPEIRVSDVAHLARTLGGRDLYELEFAPLRELIQNAADAIEARAAIDQDFSPDDGRITVRVKSLDGEGLVLLEVEDNGLGMSERVLTGPLIDFGTSFWKSSLIKSERPGLQGLYTEPRGRYGIGLFSAFMWSNELKVTSRPFDAGRSDAKVLQFSGGLARRPILRTLLAGEEIGAASTRVSLVLSKETVDRLFDASNYPREGVLRYNFYLDRSDAPKPSWLKGWGSLISLLCGLLEIKVTFEEDGRREITNLFDWRTTESERFISFFSALDRLSAPGSAVPLQSIEAPDQAGSAERLSPVRVDGRLVGRVYLSRDGRRERMGAAPFVYEKGIYVCRHDRSQAFGALEGKTTRADREEADFPLPEHDPEWTADQERKVFIGAENLGETLAAQQALVHIGALNDTQPCFIIDREIVSLRTAAEKVLTLGGFDLRFVEESGRRLPFRWKVPSEIAVLTSRGVNRKMLYPLVEFDVEVKEDSDLHILANDSEQPAFAKVLRRLLSALGETPRVLTEVDEEDTYDRRRRLFFRVARVKGAG